MTAEMVRLYAAMTPEMVRDVLAKFGAFVADRGRCGKASDLPYPASVIEMALFKALREWPLGEMHDRVGALYVTLDSFLLSDQKHDMLVAYWDSVSVLGEKAERAIGKAATPEEAHTFLDEVSTLEPGTELLEELAANAAKRLAVVRELQQRRKP
jgi:hypothetical protein